MLRFSLLVSIALVALGSTERYEVTSGSHFWIDGTATTGAWTCATEAVTGQGILGGEELSATVTVPVRAFDCGSGQMNRDMRRALRAADHPTISFDLANAEVLRPEPLPGVWVRVRASGTLRLAGAERPLSLIADGRQRADGRVEIRGRQPLRMSDFGVSPPSHVLGLVRAHDDIVVRFNLIATPTR